MNITKLFVGMFLIAFTLSVESCNKKDSAVPEAVHNTPSTVQSGNYGVFVSRKQAIITNTLISTFGNFSIAFVSNTALIGNNPTVGSLLDMGTVNLNGTIFQKNAYSAPNMYGDSASVTYNTPHNWIISGSAAVSSFSYSNTNLYPVYTGYTSILDSFIVSNNISIPLTNYNGSDEVETYFATSTNPVVNTSVQTITGAPSSLNFTASDLSIIGLNSNVTLVINFYKNNIQTINGKSYNFRTGYSVIKTNIKFK